MSEIVVYINGYKCHNGQVPARITPRQAGELLTALNTTEKKPYGCFDTFHVTTHISCRGGDKHGHGCGGDIKISTSLDNMRDFDFNRCRCMRNGGPLNCEHMLSSGNCADEFMRATVGAILFPQFYAKVK